MGPGEAYCCVCLCTRVTYPVHAPTFSLTNSTLSALMKRCVSSKTLTMNLPLEERNKTARGKALLLLRLLLGLLPFIWQGVWHCTGCLRQPCAHACACACACAHRVCMRACGCACAHADVHMCVQGTGHSRSRRLGVLVDQQLLCGNVSATGANARLHKDSTEAAFCFECCAPLLSLPLLCTASATA